LGGGATYTVAATFDTADGIVGGSQVKIAGAVVGRVQRVDLVPGPKARIVMAIDRRFEPFRSDASCKILPEGLVSENYVECSPGTSSPPLLRGSDREPTVPVSQTTIPVSLQQFLNVFSASTDERMRVMLDELGIATAGRGADINAILRRSNPALVQAQRVLSILDRQRGELSAGIAQTNQVLQALAMHDQSVRQFVDRAASASGATAAHPDALAQSFKRFPPMLEALRPTLLALDRAAVTGTPVLQSLRQAAPELTHLTYVQPAFFSAGERALPNLARISREGLSSERASTPFVRDLRAAAAGNVPFSKTMNSFLISARNGGGIEGFLRSWYGAAATTAAYDQVSHFQTLFYSQFPSCYQNPPGAGCDGRYTAPGHGTIPPNDPACGPQGGEPWNPPTNCVPSGTVPPPTQPPAANSSARHRRLAAPKAGPPRQPAPSASERSTVAGIVRQIAPTTSQATPSSLLPLLDYLLAR
jgi:virulence factor Mce-like protein